MEWTEKHDVLFCREVLVIEPFQCRKGTNERGKAWSDIAEALNALIDDGVNFKVNQRAVRERLALLQSKFKKKVREEDKASGITPDPVSEREWVQEKDRERCGETKKRKEEEGESNETKPKRKRSGNETTEYLKEKANRDHKLRELELEIKRKEQEEFAEMCKSESQRQQVMQQQTHNMQAIMMQQQ